MRDRLIRLLCGVKCVGEDRRNGGCNERVDDECVRIERLHSCQIAQIADHLLENGVIVPPCKVGDVVYSPRENGILEQNVISIEIEKDPHVRVYFTCDYLCDGCPHEQTYQNQAGDGGCYGEYGESLFAFEDFGKTVFLTREEAERTLKGENHAEIH